LTFSYSVANPSTSPHTPPGLKDATLTVPISSLSSTMAQITESYKSFIELHRDLSKPLLTHLLDAETTEIGKNYYLKKGEYSKKISKDGKTLTATLSRHGLEEVYIYKANNDESITISHKTEDAETELATLHSKKDLFLKERSLIGGALISLEERYLKTEEGLTEFYKQIDLKKLNRVIQPATIQSGQTVPLIELDDIDEDTKITLNMELTEEYDDIDITLTPVITPTGEKEIILKYLDKNEEEKSIRTKMGKSTKEVKNLYLAFTDIAKDYGVNTKDVEEESTPEDKVAATDGTAAASEERGIATDKAAAVASKTAAAAPTETTEKAKEFIPTKPADYGVLIEEENGIIKTIKIPVEKDSKDYYEPYFELGEGTKSVVTKQELEKETRNLIITFQENKKDGTTNYITTIVINPNYDFVKWNIQDFNNTALSSDYINSPASITEVKENPSKFF